MLENQAHMHTLDQIRSILDQVYDPEIPVLTIADLGILRDVRLENDGVFAIDITPTYSGCPAMDAITVNIKATLQENGIENVRINLVLTPAWTTDWLTAAGRAKLLAYGIAPPLTSSSDKRALSGAQRVLQCPFCHSVNTLMISQFSSTSCKAMFRCEDCLEVFDYFKCH